MALDPDLQRVLERIATALETIASVVSKKGVRGGGKITINDTGKWKLEGQDSINGNRFPYEEDFDSKEEAIDKAREDQDKYDKIVLISPDGKKSTLNFT